MCGRLNQALYGTRDAALNLEHAYMDFMESVGLVRGIATPCMCLCIERNILAVLHGDDFNILASAEHLDWFTDRLAQRFQVKSPS